MPLLSDSSVRLTLPPHTKCFCFVSDGELVLHLEWHWESCWTVLAFIFLMGIQEWPSVTFMRQQPSRTAQFRLKQEFDYPPPPLGLSDCFFHSAKVINKQEAAGSRSSAWHLSEGLLLFVSAEAQSFVPQFKDFSLNNYYFNLGGTEETSQWQVHMSSFPLYVFEMMQDVSNSCHRWHGSKKTIQSSKILFLKNRYY